MATQIATAELPVIRAAGGIMLRGSPSGNEVMIVFRARHEDWTLPKGKLKDGETFQEAALREVEEETGCRCDLGDYLGMISYAHLGVPKVVMFWRMTVLEERPRSDDDEITQALWLPVEAAIQCLTYAQEKSLLTHVASARAVGSGAAPQIESELQKESIPVTDAASVAVLEALNSLVAEPVSASLLEILPVSEPEALSSDAAEHASETVEHTSSPVTGVASSGPLELVPLAVPDSDAPASSETTPSLVLENPSVSDDELLTGAEVSRAPVLQGESPTEPEPVPSPLMDVTPYLAESIVREALEPAEAPEPAKDQSRQAAPPIAEPGTSPVSRLARKNRKRRALDQELEAFRVEMEFLVRRGHNAEDSWASAAEHHLRNAALCLESKDLEGGWIGLRAARRYAVRGLGPAELAARGQVLREEGLKMFSWRGAAIQRLLAGDEKLTAARLSDAMLLRDEDDEEQQQRARTSEMRLRLLIIGCIAGAAALVGSFYVGGSIQYRALLGFLGLLGAALSAAQQITRRGEEGKIFGSMAVVALMVTGAVAGLAADPIYQYTGRYLTVRHIYDLAAYPLAFLLGYAAERSFSYFASFSREQLPVRY